MPGGHVGEEPQAQRERLHQLPDQLDRGHDRQHQRALAVVAGHHDRDTRLAWQGIVGRQAQDFPHHPERFLRFSIRPGQSEAPVFNLRLTFEPVVGVTEKDGAGQPGSKGRLNLPGENLAFGPLAFADGVNAKFAEHQRFGVRQRLQPREIVLKRFPVVEIHVEAHEIDALRPEKFGRRK